MKKIRITAIILVAALIAIALISCSSKAPGDYDNGTGMPLSPPYEYADKDTNNEFTEIVENGFVKASEQPSSAFSLHVSTAAYSNLRRYVSESRAIDRNQIKIEEIVNYFKYDYPAPQNGEPLSVTTGYFDCPWNPEAMLVTIGLKAEEIDIGQVKNNIVFLLDVSGSMASPDRLGLVQSAFKLLVDNLKADDRISIVTYAGSDKVLLRGERGDKKDKINMVIDTLSAGGSTAGAQGIVTAYEIAEQYFIQGGNNRVILATDGAFNVGISSQSELENLISEKKDSGVYLTVLGFGYGNLKNNKLETLATKGNGNYFYIDTLQEARRVFVEMIGGTLVTVARDAKARVEFNPEYVDSYRLLGYENLLLTEDEWEDEKTDAGEIGSSFTVTAVYEVLLADAYENAAEEPIYEVKVRYKSPDINDDTVNEMSVTATLQDYYDTPNDDMLFISALIEVCLLLRNSQYKGEASINAVLQRLAGMQLSDPYRIEFCQLVNDIKVKYFMN